MKLKEDPPTDPNELAELARDPADDKEIELKRSAIAETEKVSC